LSFTTDFQDERRIRNECKDFIFINPANQKDNKEFSDFLNSLKQKIVTPKPSKKDL